MIESGPKVEELKVIQKVHGVCSVTCILTILSMTLFYKQKEFNSEIIFVLVFKYDFWILCCKRHKMSFLVKCIFCKGIALNL